MDKSAIRIRGDLLGDEIPSLVRRDLIGGESHIPKMPETVNAEQLANLLGISPRMVTEYAGREIVIRKSHGHYGLKESVRAYCKHLRDRASSDSLTQERVRQTKEQADLIAFKNAKLKGELLSAIEVEREWASILRDVRAALLAIPSRMQQRVGTLTVNDVAAIDREIRDALSELGGGDADRSV